MPRNSAGTYALPEAAFQAGTVIASSAMNTNLSDIATAITQSLATTGVSAMTGQIFAATGTTSAPGYAFASDTSSGFYLAGTHQIGLSTSGTLLATFNSDQTSSFANTVRAPGFQTNAGGIITPVGTVAHFAGSSAPTGWQLCGGQAISRTTYAALFAVISTTYGIGDGSSTFNLPDCRGRALYGVDNMVTGTAGRISVGGGNFDGTILGNNGGAQNHTMTTGELVAHNHTGSGNVSDPSHAHNMANGYVQPVVGANVLGGTTGLGTGTATNLAVTGITVPSLNINNTGSGNPFTVLSPGIIFNVIIFSGVP